MADQQSNHTHTIEREALERILSDANAEPIQISYQFVKSITKNFSEVVGRGGFGEVYLGFHRNEKKVAVKKIFGSQDFSDKPFLDEINCLMMVKHKNIARFLAYCAETKEQLIKYEGRFILADVRQRFLCFEYLPNGNLDAYLKDNCRGDDWQTRYQMIIGVCQGLNYLHQKRINHLDLKPENILLDALLEPKITDFGVSRFFSEGQSRIITKSIVGTFGYIAPEILQHGEISFKADVYSLGSIIIKLLTGHDKYDYENWHKSLDMENPQLKSCMEIASNCRHDDQHKRPSISEIICQLKDMESMAENGSWVNQELRNGRQLSSIYQVCAICLVNPSDMAFGCGHQICSRCGSLESCPACGSQIGFQTSPFLVNSTPYSDTRLTIRHPPASGMPAAATTEGFLQEDGFPVETSFSPSPFLDLPPAPHSQDDTVASDDLDSNDLALSYISRMLMEEDIDDRFFYQYPDHPILTEQEPYTQLFSDALNGAPAIATSSDFTTNISSTGLPLPTSFSEDTKPVAVAAVNSEHEEAPFFDGPTGGHMGMLNMAFLDSIEESDQFLPANNAHLVDLEATSGKFLPRDGMPVLRGFTSGGCMKEDVVHGPTLMFSDSRGRKRRHHTDDMDWETDRNYKLMMPDPEEAGAGELFDEMMLHGHEMLLKGLQDLHVAMGSDTEKNSRKVARGRRGGASDVVDLHTMLIHCAQAVATADRRSATELLKQIKQHSNARGDATQRLAHCFAEGLEARLAGTGSNIYQSLVSRRTSVVEFLRAYQLFITACSFKNAYFIFAAKTIIDAVAGKSRLHIVDYGLEYGFLWPVMLRWLADREGGPPEVRITGIDLPQPGFRPAYQIEETGRRLSNFACEFKLPFKFQGIAAKWETIHAEDLNLDPDEVLVINTQSGFAKIMDESVVTGRGSPRDVILRNIREMRPHVFIMCVSNGTYDAPFFMTRFREALFFYSAHFDMLDANIPRDNDVRLLIEREILGSGALNIIACEGADRVDRPETYKQCQVRNQRARLRQLPLNQEAVKAVRINVKNHYHKDFFVDVDGMWLLQGWKGRVLSALSTWVAADDDNSIF